MRVEVAQHLAQLHQVLLLLRHHAARVLLEEHALAVDELDEVFASGLLTNAAVLVALYQWQHFTRTGATMALPPPTEERA